MGGGLETATPATASSEVKLGLCQREIWVKGMVLNGVVINDHASFGMCIKFGQLETGDRDPTRRLSKIRADGHGRAPRT